MSAPAAKNPWTAELRTSAFAEPASSASRACSSPSTSGAPSAFAGGRASTTCSTPSRSSWRTGRSSVAMPVHRSGDEDVAREPPPQELLHLARGGDERLEVDPRLDPHLVEHRHEVLAGDVAGRARGDGAATELAKARLEARDAGAQRGQRVGQP